MYKIFNNINITFSFKDRVLVMFGANIKVEQVIFTEKQAEVTKETTKLIFK